MTWKPPANSWTDERIEALKAAQIQGLSSSQIAKQLGGITRNAVIGKLHRLGLTRRKPETARITSGLNGANRRIALRRLPDPQEALPRAYADVRKLQPLPHTDPRPWTTRLFGECAFPVSGDGADIVSCCAPCLPSNGWSYCARHMEIITGRKAAPTIRRAAIKRRQHASRLAWAEAQLETE